MKCSTTDLGIIDDEKSENSLISFDNLHIPSTFNNLIPFKPTLQRVQSYEDKNLRRYILSSIIPLEDFNRKISNRKTSTDIDKRDLLLFELLRWFKEDFFTWFNQPNCNRCQISMKFVEYTQPTREERDKGDAHRVEFYRCSTCSSEYRFPRYNAPLKLLETRSGRCGEAANLFACLCRALSFRTRYIHDPSDHVWTEVYSENEHRWLHCDSCENLCDSPLVYEKGWKKNLSFCIAFAKDHVEDVTWRYVTNFKETIQRRNINEKDFVKTIHRINQKIQSQIDQQEKKKIISM
jgi:peptide-N4-(N-acetyl-beta-glucosaminyl)asparagine amidase